MIALPAAAACGQAPAPATRPGARDRQAERLLAAFLTTDKLPGPPWHLWEGRGFLMMSGLPSAEAVALWVEQFGQWAQQKAAKQAAVVNLLKLGPAAARAANRALAKTRPGGSKAIWLAAILGLVGDRESVPLLIDLLTRPATPAAQPVVRRLGAAGPWASPRRTETYLAATWALWELSGRKFQNTSPVLISSTEWKTWWQAVDKSFHPARDRAKLRVTEAQVALLVAQLGAKDDELVRERLIVLGPNALPHLFKALAGEKSQKLRIRLAWVIDELGAVAKVPAPLRRVYFTHRLQQGDPRSVLWKMAAGRSFAQQDLADAFRAAVEADRQLAAAGHRPRVWAWLHLESRRFAAAVEAKMAEVPAAVPVLIRYLSDPDKVARSTAVKIADELGFTTKAKPAKLLEALEKRWHVEPDDRLRYNTVFALSRFDTPAVTRAIKKGLWSDREQIVGDCASLAGGHAWSRMRGPEKDDIDARLLELTAHENDRIRRGSFRALVKRAPRLLVPHLDRLCTDSVRDIRSYCISVMRELKDPAHTERLVALAFDKDARVRGSALMALGDPVHRKAIPRLAPLLKGGGRDMHQAQWAIVGAGGPEAVAVLVQEIRQGNTVGNSIFQALQRAS